MNGPELRHRAASAGIDAVAMAPALAMQGGAFAATGHPMTALACAALCAGAAAAAFQWSRRAQQSGPRRTIEPVLPSRVEPMGLAVAAVLCLPLLTLAVHDGPGWALGLDIAAAAVMTGRHVTAERTPCPVPNLTLWLLGYRRILLCEDTARGRATTLYLRSSTPAAKLTVCTMAEGVVLEHREDGERERAWRPTMRAA